MVFPSKESLGMAIRGGGVTLPASKVQASVAASSVDPSAVEQLVEVKVLLFGIPLPFATLNDFFLVPGNWGAPLQSMKILMRSPWNPSACTWAVVLQFLSRRTSCYLSTCKGIKCGWWWKLIFLGARLLLHRPSPWMIKRMSLKTQMRKIGMVTGVSMTRKRTIRCSLRLLKGNRVEVTLVENRANISGH
jgi:hypothetical protein